MLCRGGGPCFPARVPHNHRLRPQVVARAGWLRLPGRFMAVLLGRAGLYWAGEGCRSQPRGASPGNLGTRFAVAGVQFAVSLSQELLKRQLAPFSGQFAVVEAPGVVDFVILSCPSVDIGWRRGIDRVIFSLVFGVQRHVTAQNLEEEGPPLGGIF